MTPQPLIGLVFHALGGVAAASFYAPLKFIRLWPWESFYLVMGIFAWLLTPWLFAWSTTPQLLHVLGETPPEVLGLTFLFGLLWGIGAVTYGLSMRYLGMALGMSVTLGFCALFGTLLPPLVKGEFTTILASIGGQVVLLGVFICAGGIAIAGYAGIRKEKEMPHDGADDTSGDSEFSLYKGLFVSLISGLMSACFAFGLQSGAPIAERALAAGTHPLLQNNAILCVILAGGLLTNTLWCLFLNWRNATFSSYRSASPQQSAGMLSLCALAGVIWYFQFFFYGMGATKMGQYEFSSWTLHMAFIIICGNLWGLAFREWKGVSLTTLSTVWAGIFVLVVSTMVIGYGNSLTPVSAGH